MSTVSEIVQMLGLNVATPPGVVGALGAVAVAEGGALGGSAGLGVLLAGLLGVAWAALSLFRLPRARRTRFGLLLGIAGETREEVKRVEADFAFRFCELARKGSSGGDIELLRLPQYWANRALDDDAARSILHKARGKYLLVCRVRRRPLHGREAWFLELRAVVAHKPIAGHDRRALQREFAELLPRQRAPIDAEEQLPQFELEAQKSELVSRYILGIAAYLSGDIDMAEKLFADVAGRLEGALDSEAGRAIAGRLAMRTSEISISRAGAAYVRWLKTFAAEDALECKRQLERVPAAGKGREDYIALRALQQFVTDRDAVGALATLKTSRYQGAAAWRLSCAFLRAYLGNLREAACLYREVARMAAGPEQQTLLEVEEFLFWFQGQPGGAWIASYCLGLFDMCIKNDDESAEQELRRFLAECPQGQYKAERQRVARWVMEIEARRAKRQDGGAGLHSPHSGCAGSDVRSSRRSGRSPAQRPMPELPSQGDAE